LYSKSLYNYSYSIFYFIYNNYIVVITLDCIYTRNFIILFQTMHIFNNHFDVLLWFIYTILIKLVLSLKFFTYFDCIKINYIIILSILIIIIIIILIFPMESLWTWCFGFFRSTSNIFNYQILIFSWFFIYFNILNMYLNNTYILSFFSKFQIVEFSDGIQIVHSSWLTKNMKKCMYSLNINNESQYKKMVTTMFSPQKTWSLLNVLKVIGSNWYVFNICLLYISYWNILIKKSTWIWILFL